MIEQIGLKTARSLTFLWVVGAGLIVVLALWYLRLWGGMARAVGAEVRARWLSKADGYEVMGEKVGPVDDHVHPGRG